MPSSGKQYQRQRRCERSGANDPRCRTSPDSASPASDSQTYPHRALTPHPLPGTVWSCLLTIFLCTWTALCLNIPHPNDSKLRIFLRKTNWMLWGILGPELVLSVAIGQYASARRSVRRFERLGCTEWTIRHAFFADMGGILLQPKNRTPFLVNGRQLAYLVERGYTGCLNISAHEIWDQSKADTMTRLLTLAQAAWLIVQLCGRTFQDLPTMILDLSMAAIVFCSFGTFLCWAPKRSDRQRGIMLSIDATTAGVLVDAGEDAAET